jgi:hypothetical protein
MPEVHPPFISISVLLPTGTLTARHPLEETLMRDFVRPVAAALGIAALLRFRAASHGAAFAQAKQQQMAPPQKQAARRRRRRRPQPELKQIALTDKQIEACSRHRRTWTRSPTRSRTTRRRIPRSTPSSTTSPRRYGFAGYPDYNTVVDNISLVLGGVDPATKKYVGAEAVIKAQIAQVPGRQEDVGQGQEGSALPISTKR